MFVEDRFWEKRSVVGKVSFSCARAPNTGRALSVPKCKEESLQPLVLHPASTATTSLCTNHTAVHIVGASYHTIP